MSTDDEARAAAYAARTCKTCACYAVIGPNGAELERDHAPGALAQPSCRLNPPLPVQQRMERPMFKPSGEPLMQLNKETGRQEPRMESVMAWLAIHPPTLPQGRCWQWRPLHVLPGASHWVPEKPTPLSVHALPAPAGDPPS
jgi:hypothetical protein